jgi:hypothetical protein
MLEAAGPKFDWDELTTIADRLQGGQIQAARRCGA